MNRTAIALTCAALMLGSCDQAGTSDTPAARPTVADMPAPPASVASPTLEPAGPPRALTPDPGDSIQWAASVVAFDELPGQPGATVKLFGLAGGDPAMNGLQTFIAFYVSPADGWRVFQIGDFLGYRVIGEAPGRVDLEIDESTYDDATGDIGSRTRRLILTWTASSDEPPAAVELAEAR